MLEIKVTDFRDYTYQEIFEYLEIQQQFYFKIALPKKFTAPGKSLYVFWDYYTALYVGEQLSLLSEYFAYYVPCPYTKSDFFFEIACTDRKALAATIHHILSGCQERSAGFEAFHDLASDFFTAVTEDRIKPRCEGFMPLIIEYLNMQEPTRIK